jgi:ankyrin repeat protein
MNKKAFIKSVRKWDLNTVKAALAEDSRLASYADQNGKRPLHHCAEANAQKTGLRVADSIKTARALISAGADVNAVRVIMDEGEEFHARPLWYAVAWGKNLELARFLLDNGADPNGCMFAAAWDENIEIAKLLHSRGAEIDPVAQGETPLLLIIKSWRLKLLDWLIANGADINFQSPNGYSALHFAIKRKYTAEQIQLLLDHGANPLLKAKDGSTPISLAMDQNRKKTIALLKGQG